MAGKISVEKMIKPFTGEGDVLAWLQKVELVAKLGGFKDLASFIPLYLEDGALAVYLEMPDEKKVDASLIQDELVKAFSDNQFVAFSKLKAVRWAGEPVDVYANEIRRLARGCGFSGDGAEQLAKLTFITGFPDSISVELQQLPGVEKLKLGDVIPRARVLASNRGVGGVAAAALKERRLHESRSSDTKGREPLRCFECGGPHLKRDCPEIECHNCKGCHLIKDCPELRNNESRSNKGISGCAVGGVIHKGLNGCVAGGPQKDFKVPMVNMMVGGRCARALVDTGCTTTMVNEELVKGVEGEATVTAFDGREVKCKGTAHVHMEVAGEQVDSEVTVGGQMLEGVDVVMGMDVIEALGGVRVCRDQVQFGRSLGGMSYTPTCRRKAVSHIVSGRVDEPKKRQKLKLLPRSRPFEAACEGVGNRSIFGWAKPVDTAAKDREIERKMKDCSLGASWLMHGRVAH